MDRTEEEEDSVDTVLANQPLLHRIFSGLQGQDLNTCRGVNKLWELEAGSHMQEFRKCRVIITDETYGDSNLRPLSLLESEFPRLPIIKSLQIGLQRTPSVTALDPSATVTKVKADFTKLSLPELRQMFPNLTEFIVEDPTPAVPYNELWAFWPELTTVHLMEWYHDILARNFDADFLGIHHDEVELLRTLDAEVLEQMQIVPTRPSVLTMRRLESLKISVVDMGMGGGWPNRPRDQSLLSKVTGILAFKRMTRIGIKIQFVTDSDEIVDTLRHLGPFASVGYLDRHHNFVPL